jgi:hypothetical protein
MNLVANFNKTYTVTISVNDSEYGKAYIGNNQNETSITVEEGGSATLTAVAYEGYKFTGWKEDRKTPAK